MATSLALGTSLVTLSSSELSANIFEACQESQILTSYALNCYLGVNDIQVAVDDGVATLSGNVNEDISKQLAKRIAMGVSGINDVNNQIEVDAGYTPPQRSGDRTYGEVAFDATIIATFKGAF